MCEVATLYFSCMYTRTHTHTHTHTKHLFLFTSLSTSVSPQEQASWVCECEETLVARLEQDFKSTLQQQNSLEQWASWLESVVNTVLEPYVGGNQFTKAARQFLLKWSFYR